MIKDVASQLGKKRLAIVADGALQYIPFAALPEPSPENDKGRNSGAGPQPLFVEHEIVSLPSASTLATLRIDESLATGKSVRVDIEAFLDASQRTTVSEP